VRGGEVEDGIAIAEPPISTPAVCRELVALTQAVTDAENERYDVLERKLRELQTLEAELRALAERIDSAPPPRPLDIPRRRNDPSVVDMRPPRD
jgi:hypothetical protein